jgi:antitoxin HicB
MKNEAARDREYYVGLPYTVILRKDTEGDWIASIDEFEGCIAHGSTQLEALENVEEIKGAWIDDALEAGDQIPEPPSHEELPSGKWLQRVPRSLHKKVSALAKAEDVSLNQLVTSILAEAVGRKTQVVVRDEETSFYRSSVHRRAMHSLWSFHEAPRADWKITQPATLSHLTFTSCLKHIAMISAKPIPEEDATKKELAHQA